jgi:hypothetical protein
MAATLHQGTSCHSRAAIPVTRVKMRTKDRHNAIRRRPSDAISRRLVPRRVAFVVCSVTVKLRSNDQEADHPSWVTGL